MDSLNRYTLPTGIEAHRLELRRVKRRALNKRFGHSLAAQYIYIFIIYTDKQMCNKAAKKWPKDKHRKMVSIKYTQHKHENEQNKAH